MDPFKHYHKALVVVRGTAPAIGTVEIEVPLDFFFEEDEIPNLTPEQIDEITRTYVDNLAADGIGIDWKVGDVEYSDITEIKPA